ncbi:MAG: valine--tRNA ligase [Acidobacteria bacterium]|nr:valine--tRNA ligase [Acidobacteriota bacterium]
MELDKIYEPQRFEPHWAEWWETSGIFKADASHKGRAFSIAIPPPNVTGSLHIGHMIGHTEMDMVTRYHRMLGDNTLWIPGTDHAGIATQMVVERELAKNGVTRHDLGREKFEERVWEWKAQYGGNIERQMRKIGDSVDWSRNRFTFDPGLSRAVREIFVRLYEKGLIYRGEYMVTWCPRCGTAISDLEVNHEDTAGSLWEIKYPVKGHADRFLTVATTRPETMLGDTAVAINARDERYTDLHGATVILPLAGREIPIILDDMADPEFGTGVVKVTPAHDPNDFEAGKRHNLPHVRVIDQSGKMTDDAGAAYAGLSREAARKKVLADLEAAGLLSATKPHNLPISKCQRCQTNVEPLVSKQWFVKMEPLAKPAIEAVETGKIEFVPENWANTYFHWMRNIRDWCISRQLWWGHRVPAWHCTDCNEITVDRKDPTHCHSCGSANITQDSDVLDTWFSSGLWPFSTLGWPDETPDLKAYYPTSVLITGFDIIFFWVARMIVFGLECTGEVPFRQVYIHGLVRDAERQKMSKTKGNVIDPLEVTEKYGTDAVRMSLVLAAPPGTDIISSEDRMQSARAFANKIWNAARFLFLNLERAGAEPWAPEEKTAYSPEPVDGALTLEDRWIFSSLNTCAGEVNKALEAYRFHEAANLVWHFFWDDFCDWYIELKKLRFREGSGLDANWRNILTVFESALRLLHPAMPFITEELWQRLCKDREGRPVSIALAQFPQFNEAVHDADAVKDFAILQEIIGAARNLRADAKLDPKQQLDALIYCDGSIAALATAQKEAIERLGNVALKIEPSTADRAKGAKRATPAFDIVLAVPAAQLEKQRDRLTKEIGDLEKVIANSQRQLGNEDFVKKAPEKVLATLREKLAGYEAQLEKSRQALAEL